MFSVIELLIMGLWYRAKAMISRIYSRGVSPETSLARLPLVNRLPQEIVEMIIGHLFYDPFSLRACCLTCYSWYIAAVRHLHSALITPIYRKHGSRKLWWHGSFQSMHKLGLLPLVKKLQVQGTRVNPDRFGPSTFSPELVDRRILRQFSSLTNVQELGIDFLDIASFMPEIRHYFGHFLPTLRSLALREPKGSRQQIIFFIGLFQRLEDLAFRYDSVVIQREPADDPTLIPLSIPPLRGRLKLEWFTRVGILEDMIGMFGGIRFRHMELLNVDGMRLLLDAAKTLETLQLCPYDPRGKARLTSTQVLANNFSANFSPNFDLSQNTSLRALEVTMGRMVTILYVPLIITQITKNLGHALSTIRSPTFSEVVVIYQDRDIPAVHYQQEGPPALWWLSPTQKARFASERRIVFEVLRELRRAHDFNLVLCADVWGCARIHAMRELKQAVLEERRQGGLDNMSSRLMVTYRLREFLPSPGEPVSRTVPFSKWVHPWAPPPVGY